MTVGIIEYPAVTVSTASTWPQTEAAWTARPTLRLLRAVKACAPEMPHAELQQIFGETNETDRTTFAVEAPLDIVDDYVRIEIGADAWYGIIVGEVADHYGGDGANDSGELVFQAFGLEHLLTRQYVTGSQVYDPGGDVVPPSWFEINRVMTFNQTHIRGGEIALGNRSAVQEASKWYFVEDGVAWSTQTIVQYILSHYMTGPISTTPGGLIADLAQEIRVVDVFGRTLYQILSSMIDRRRGYTWSIRVEDMGVDAPAEPSIIIHSMFAVPKFVGDLKFSMNAEKGAVPLGAEELLNIYPETCNRIIVDRVRVVGQPIRCVCTVGQNVPPHGFWNPHDVPPLPDDWTAALETAVKDGAKNEVGYDDLSVQEKMSLNAIVRSREIYKPVFARFALDADAWTTVINAYGMAISTDGDFELNGALTRAGVLHLGWGRPFRRELPLKEGVDYSADTWPALVADTMSPRPPFAAIFGADEQWRDASDLQIPWTTNARVAVENRKSALWIQFSPAHRFAGETEWDGAEWSGYAPNFGATRTFAATICFELDEHLRVVRHIAANAHADFARELVIYVPDAQLIYAHVNTAVGVDDDGDLEWIAINGAMDGVIYDGGWAVAVTLRDDSERLRAIALMAAEWYGQSRDTTKFLVNGMEDFALPGKYITEVSVVDGQTYDVWSIVTKQTWDARTGTTLVETNWFDVDWVKVVGISAPGHADSAGFARAVDQGLAAAESAREEDI